MGNKGSKKHCLQYEQAIERVSKAELKRINEAFKQLTDGGTLLSKKLFVENVLSIDTPTFVTEQLFLCCGGTSKGISLQDLTCGLVLLTKGLDQEKIRFLWNIYSNESGTQITSNDFRRFQKYESPGNIAKQITVFNILFDDGKYDFVTFEQFYFIISYNRSLTTLSEWLLNNKSAIKLTCSSHDPTTDLPTFYQTLAGVTHLNEMDISQLEKHFWFLQSYSCTNLIDYKFFTCLISPPVPLKLVDGLFQAFDVNHDGHIDFKELCCGVSSACRGPIGERLKFCFKLFDKDLDCVLNCTEFQNLIDVVTIISRDDGYEISLSEELNGASMTLDEFLVWGHKEMKYLSQLIRLLFEVCHISLGLRTLCHHQEYEIVQGWLDREVARGYSVGQYWYVVSSEWWKTWQNYTRAIDHCTCGTRPASYSLLTIEEGVVCDENMTSIDSMNDDNSSTIGDNFSVSSSSGISTSSAMVVKSFKKPGPIDNSALVILAQPNMENVRNLTGEGGQLRSDKELILHSDFELVPDSIWKALAHWYGAPLPLPRQVIELPHNSREVELYPYRLRLYQHSVDVSNSVSNWKNSVGNYGSLATPNFPNYVPVNSSRKVLKYTATFSRLATVKHVLDFLCENLSLKLEDARLWLMSDETLLLDDETQTLEQLAVRQNDRVLLEIRNKNLTWPEEMGALSNNSLRERKTSIILPVGVVGLLNLGNTCFLNSALQAVSNTQPLTLYFQRDGLTELNCNNPNGTKGQVARKYAALCRKLWSRNVYSFAPIDLRNALSKNAPHLTGGGQHDSQELLAFLLDALHEDLNRVTKKEYIELQDSDGRPDYIVASEAWQNHLKRDHSIITDLFHGQLKSKVTCQTCGHESVRFDPFNMLSLPLPMESYVLYEVIVIKCDDSIPVQYGIRINSELQMCNLKKQLSKLCGIDESKLLLAKVSNSFITEILPNDYKIGSDTILNLYAYELPFSIKSDTNQSEENNCYENLLDVGGTNNGNDEVKDSSPFYLYDILCFKSFRKKQNSFSDIPLIDAEHLNHPKAQNLQENNDYRYLIAVHRKNVRQEMYFLSHQKIKTSIFGVPLIVGYNNNTTTEDLYESIWLQVTRLLSPLPKQELLNHATDCDDSLRYEYPFHLKIVKNQGVACGRCPWTDFCRGCIIDCTKENFSNFLNSNTNHKQIQIAIDWEATALYLRYQTNREKMYIEHESVAHLRRIHNDPIDVDHCLRAFTSEEKLETMYQCSKCNSMEPATKKLKIWRLPPLLIVHLKRFDFVKGKWAKTHKMVNFPFDNFNPTEYLASVPMETIYRYQNLVANEKNEHVTTPPTINEHFEDFHQHHLKNANRYLDLNYHLYAFITHTGMLNGGHYVCYASNPNGKWYMYNDSTCREIQIDARSQPLMNSAYILFYERSGLNYEPYIPKMSNQEQKANGDCINNDKKELSSSNGADYEFKYNCKLS